MNKNLRTRKLHHANSSIEFTKCWLQVAKSKERAPSFEALAQKAGFSSRSFVRQVLIGEKPMTLRSFPQFVNLMKLDRNHEKLLRLLLELENPLFNFSKRSKAQIQAEMSVIRNRIEMRNIRKVESTAIGKTQFKRMGFLYAFLSREQGQTLETLSMRSKLPVSDCEKTLQLMIEQSFASCQDNLFFATERLVQAIEPAATELLKSHMTAGIDLLKNELQSSSELSKEQLFFRAQYSIDPNRLLEFKSQLRNLLIEFVESTESDEGPKVGNLVCAFF